MAEHRWVTREDVGSASLVTLRAPKHLNSLHAPMMQQLLAILRDLQADGSVRAVILTGTGRAFCSGAHVGEMIQMEDRANEIAELLDAGWNAVLRLIRGMPKPVIAAVNGIAAGGGVGLALSADMTIAARSARFIQVFGPNLAVIPDVGSTWLLPHAIGRARTMALMLTGDRLTARQAKDWGLIASCVEDDALQDEAFALARQLADGPIEAFAEIRKAVDHAMTCSLDAALDHERDTNARLCAGPGFNEGAAAFLEKRRPDFRNY